MRVVWVGVSILLLVVAASGCESNSAIPAGAQEVRVATAPASIQLTPATVPAGDVYFVLDPLPSGVRLAFVHGASGALTDADLARLARNADAEGLTTEIMDISCCGNVYKRTLEPGKYAFVVLDAQPGQPGRPPLAIDSVTVLP